MKWIDSLVPPNETTSADARTALSSAVTMPLSETATLLASGKDTDQFLQGQLSADLHQLKSGQASLAGLSDPKGRLLAIFKLTRLNEESVEMEVNRAIADGALKRLSMYLLRSKARIADRRDELATLGLIGPNASDVLTQLGLPSPSLALATVAHGDLLVRREHGVTPRFALHGSIEQLQKLWPQLSTAAPVVHPKTWRLLDIRAGLPSIHPQTQGEFVAQMVNLDLLGGISFDKGCYTGQEVIARLHYLGKLKRRMYLLNTPAPAPEPGASIHADGETQSVGTVVDAATDADGSTSLLAVLQTARADSVNLKLGAPDGPTLSVPKSFEYADARR